MFLWHEQKCQAGPTDFCFVLFLIVSTFLKSVAQTRLLILRSCVGDPSQICGGPGALTVYQSKTDSGPSPGNPAIVDTVTTSDKTVYKYQGLSVHCNIKRCPLTHILLRLL